MTNVGTAAAGVRAYLRNLNVALASSGVYVGLLQVAGMVDGSDSARHFMQTRDPSGLPEPLDPEHLARAYCSLLRDRDRFEETIGMPDADLAGIRERAQRGRACRGMDHRAVASGERGHDGRRGQQRH
jgi:hypothetical protein